MQNRYTKTVDSKAFSTADYKALRVGQWVSPFDGIRGQYLGVTSAEVVTINYRKDGPTWKTQFKANRPLRQFAKVYGSK